MDHSWSVICTDQVRTHACHWTPPPPPHHLNHSCGSTLPYYSILLTMVCYVLTKLDSGVTFAATRFVLSRQIDCFVQKCVHWSDVPAACGRSYHKKYFLTRPHSIQGPIQGPMPWAVTRKTLLRLSPVKGNFGEIYTVETKSLYIYIYTNQSKQLNG